MSTVWAYIRLSKDELKGTDTPDEKIERRRTVIRQLASDHGLLLPDDHILVEVRSGRTIEGRAVFGQILDLIRAGRVTHLLATEQTRLTRGNKREESDFEELCADFEVVVITCEGVSAPADEEYDPLPYEVRALVSRIEWRNTSKRFKRAARGNLLANKRVAGRTPYGYIRNRSSAAGYETDPRTYPLVCELFRRFLAGESCMGLLKDLNRRGVPSPKASIWSRFFLQKLLTNPFYAGYHSISSTKRGKRLIRLPEPLLAPDEGPWPHPIALADHYRIRERFAALRLPGTPRKSLLGGILRCPRDQPMRGAGHYSYICGCADAAQAHPGMRIPRARLEPWVREVVTLALRSLPDALLDVQGRPRDRRSVDAEYAAARKDLARAERAALAMIDSEEDQRRLYGAELYEIAAAKARTDWEAAKARVAELEELLCRPDPGEVLPLVVRFRSVDTAEFWARLAAAPDSERALIRGVVARIRLDEPPTVNKRVRGASVEWQSWIAPYAPRKIPRFPPAKRPSGSNHCSEYMFGGGRSED